MVNKLSTIMQWTALPNCRQRGSIILEKQAHVDSVWNPDVDTVMIMLEECGWSSNFADSWNLTSWIETKNGTTKEISNPGYLRKHEEFAFFAADAVM